MDRQNWSELWKILVIVVVVWLVGALPLFLFVVRPFMFYAARTSVDLEGTGIVLSAVAAFAGLLIPLHYSLVLDIVGKIRDHNKKPDSDKNVERLTRYCHTSDMIVFSAALFGVSSLLEGACALGSKFGLVDAGREGVFGFVLGLGFVLVVLASLIISIFSSEREWGLANSSPTFVWYVVFNCLSGSLSLLWAMVLMSRPCLNQVAFAAMVAVTLYYGLWLMLRVAFTPMSLVAKITIDDLVS